MVSKEWKYTEEEIKNGKGSPHEWDIWMLDVAHIVYDASPTAYTRVCKIM